MRCVDGTKRHEEARAMATIIDGKTRIPFMRGMLVHHLIQRGVAHGEARDIANAQREGERTCWP